MSAGTSGTVRLFFALWPDASATEKMHRLARDHIDQYGGRAMRPETLHLTLAFLGDLPVECLQAALTAGDDLQAASFRLALDRLAYWAHNRLLWAGCSTPNPELPLLAAALHERLRQSGFALEKRAFLPHMTLARNLQRSPPKEAAIAPVEWECRDFVLVRSLNSGAGADYEKVRSWRLAV